MNVYPLYWDSQDLISCQLTNCCHSWAGSSPEKCVWSLNSLTPRSPRNQFETGNISNPMDYKDFI